MICVEILGWAGPAAAGKVHFAKTLSPQEFQKLSADVAEVSGFVGTQVAVAKTALGKDIFSLGKKLTNIKLFQSDKALANVGNQGKNIIRNIEKELGSDIKKVFKGPG